MRELTGVVVRAHKCAKTIRVRVAKQVWNKRVRKNFTVPEYHLAHDGAEACVPGDVVRIVNGLRTSRTKRAIVSAIVSPFGTSEPRKPIQTIEEWAQARLAKRVERGKVHPAKLGYKPEIEGEGPEADKAREARRMWEERKAKEEEEVKSQWWRRGFGVTKPSAELGIKNIQGIKVDFEKVVEKIKAGEIKFKSRKAVPVVAETTGQKSATASA
ncbi:hypothetical protein BJ508DRAFT_416092 [Ascobolus immersus RN42]|uniref:Nucleic acid-binding protein n=1 Tax=Ascobolus immersus RN42 TaxID=1160509 RepID=A0A3N4HZ83_ASCIM|nr:hypothetical protein BJ508DRAFT_416092 [Ascobolus immersus RN42]